MVPVIKSPPASAGHTGHADSVPGLGRSPVEGTDNPLQYSCLGIPWTGSLAGCSPWGHKESDTAEWPATKCWSVSGRGGCCWKDHLTNRWWPHIWRGQDSEPPRPTSAQIKGQINPGALTGGHGLLGYFLVALLVTDTPFPCPQPSP